MAVATWKDLCLGAADPGVVGRFWARALGRPWSSSTTATRCCGAGRFRHCGSTGCPSPRRRRTGSTSTCTAATPPTWSPWGPRSSTTTAAGWCWATPRATSCACSRIPVTAGGRRPGAAVRAVRGQRQAGGAGRLVGGGAGRHRGTGAGRQAPLGPRWRRAGRADPEVRAGGRRARGEEPVPLGRHHRRRRAPGRRGCHRAAPATARSPGRSWPTPRATSSAPSPQRPTPWPSSRSRHPTVRGRQAAWLCGVPRRCVRRTGCGGGGSRGCRRGGWRGLVERGCGCLRRSVLVVEGSGAGAGGDGGDGGEGPAVAGIGLHRRRIGCR